MYFIFETKTIWFREIKTLKFVINGTRGSTYKNT